MLHYLSLTRVVWFVGCLLLSAGVISCNGKQAEINRLKKEVVTHYANIVFASYEDAYQATVTLQEKIAQFVANPSPETQKAAQEAWLAAREPYGQTEVYRFYGGPIDDAEGPEGLINAWPLDEGYVDYVQGIESAGIIQDMTNYPTLDKALLESLNEQGAEENISVGFHAIEFLLWGQDLSAETAGTRPHTDYLPDQNPHADRRAQYLLLTSELLVEHLAFLKDEWDVNHAGNYRTDFLALDPNQAIQQILTGMGVLSKSELAGERIFTAYDNQDQEDEHSCFSDNTHRDIVTNALGIRNVYVGSYTRTDGNALTGTSLSDLLAQINPELNQQLLDLLDSTVAQANGLPVPFDQAIIATDSRPMVLELVTTLQDQGDTIAEIANALELTINTALP